MNVLMSLYIAVLFFVLTPGILTKMPAVKSLYKVAALHALLFAAIYYMTHNYVWRLTTEGFVTYPDPYMADVSRRGEAKAPDGYIRPGSYMKAPDGYLPQGSYMKSSGKLPTGAAIKNSGNSPSAMANSCSTDSQCHDGDVCWLSKRMCIPANSLGKGKACNKNSVCMNTCSKKKKCT